MNNQTIYSAAISSLSGFLLGFEKNILSRTELLFNSLWYTITCIFSRSEYRRRIHLDEIFSNKLYIRNRRKCTLFRIAVINFLSASATESYFFQIDRLISGIATGLSSIVAPLYISEIPPNLNNRILETVITQPICITKCG